MDVEKRTKKAIILTREILLRTLDDSGAVAFMTFYEIEPDEVEEKVADILEYFEKTDPEEKG